MARKRAVYTTAPRDQDLRLQGPIGEAESIYCCCSMTLHPSRLMGIHAATILRNERCGRARIQMRRDKLT